MKTHYSQHSLNRQRGLSMPALIGLIAIGGFLLLCAFKIVPLYVENRYIVAALRSLADTQQELESMTNAQIRQRLQSFYLINNVNSEGSKNIEIERSANGVKVTIDYEGRTRLFNDAPLMGTVYVVVDFKNHLDSRRIDACCKPE